MAGSENELESDTGSQSQPSPAASNSSENLSVYEVGDYLAAEAKDGCILGDRPLEQELDSVQNSPSAVNFNQNMTEDDLLGNEDLGTSEVSTESEDELLEFTSEEETCTEPNESFNQNTTLDLTVHDVVTEENLVSPSGKAPNSFSGHANSKPTAKKVYETKVVCPKTKEETLLESSSDDRTSEENVASSSEICTKYNASFNQNTTVERTQNEEKDNLIAHTNSEPTAKEVFAIKAVSPARVDSKPEGVQCSDVTPTSRDNVVNDTSRNLTRSPERKTLDNPQVIISSGIDQTNTDEFHASISGSRLDCPELEYDFLESTLDELDWDEINGCDAPSARVESDFGKPIDSSNEESVRKLDHAVEADLEAASPLSGYSQEGRSEIGLPFYTEVNSDDLEEEISFGEACLPKKESKEQMNEDQKEESDVDGKPAGEGLHKEQLATCVAGDTKDEKSSEVTLQEEQEQDATSSAEGCEITTPKTTENELSFFTDITYDDLSAEEQDATSDAENCVITTPKITENVPSFSTDITYDDLSAEEQDATSDAENCVITTPKITENVPSFSADITYDDLSAEEISEPNETPRSKKDSKKQISQDQQGESELNESPAEELDEEVIVACVAGKTNDEKRSDVTLQEIHQEDGEKLPSTSTDDCEIITPKAIGEVLNDSEQEEYLILDVSRETEESVIDIECKPPGKTPKATGAVPNDDQQEECRVLDVSRETDESVIEIEHKPPGKTPKATGAVSNDDQQEECLVLDESRETDESVIEIEHIPPRQTAKATGEAPGQQEKYLVLDESGDTEESVTEVEHKPDVTESKVSQPAVKSVVCYVKGADAEKSGSNRDTDYYYVSNDQRENEDNEDPEWEHLRQLENDEDRHKAVKQRWRNLGLVDPNLNLTYHTFFRQHHPQNRGREAGVPTNPRESHKRSRTESAAEWRPAKRLRTMSCLELYDMEVERVREEAKKKQEAVKDRHRQAVANHLRQQQFGPAQYVNPYLHQLYQHQLQNQLMELERQKEQSLRDVDLHRATKESQLQKAREDIWTFYHQYRETCQRDPTQLQDSQVKEFCDTEDMYELYDKLYM